MFNYECWMKLGFALSFVTVVFAFVSVVILYFFRRENTKKKKVNRITIFFQNQPFLIFTAVIMLAVLFLQNSVNAYRFSVSETASLDLWSIFEYSLISTVKIFGGMDDFDKYIFTVREMTACLFDELGFISAILKSEQIVFLIKIAEAYAVLLVVVAPFAGGAFILDILTSIVPKVKLRLSFLCFWKEQFYFSELSERSLELAKNIIKEFSGKLTTPLIVFSDAYIDKDSENSTELFLDAKAIGAICLRDDLMHIPVSKKKEKKFFLIDDNEMNNLHKLFDLSHKRDISYLRKSEIYLFCADDVYDRIRATFPDNPSENDVKDSPAVIPVNVYRNLATNLLSSIPLYETKVNCKNKDNVLDIYFTILGTGKIGTEMFLAAYWMGQMLDTNLHITVVSDESEESFTGRINYINPDILDTSVAGHNILSYNKHGETAKPYFSFSYSRQIISGDNILVLLNSKINNSSARIKDSDYFVVALGADDENIAVAEKLRQKVSEYHLEQQQKKTIIAYAVYDSDLCEMLNSRRFYNNLPGSNADIFMHAFGNLSEEYSPKNVFMQDERAMAESLAYRYYDSSSARVVKLDENRKNKIIKKLLKDEYSHSANISRSLHIFYKVFSAGIIEKSLFDYSDADFSEYMKESGRYLTTFAGTDFIKDKAEKKRMYDRLAWLEHRRWCAFMRTRGFRATDAFSVYCDKTGDHKNVSLKLHPFLVECDENGIRKGLVDENCFYIEETLYDYDEDVSYDLLDKNIYAVKDFFPDKENAKMYDYINFEALDVYLNI